MDRATEQNPAVSACSCYCTLRSPVAFAVTVFPALFAQSLCHFLQTMQPIMAETGPFIGVIVDVTQCVPHVLTAIIIQAFLEGTVRIL